MYRTWKRLRPPQAVWLLLLCVYPISTSAEDFPAVDCVISPYHIVDLAAAVPGVIERVLVERSDFVKKGQIVAELSAGVELATVELARARAHVEPEINVWRVNVDYDGRRKARMQSLLDNKSVSEDDKEDADRDAELSALKLQQAHDLKIIRQRELKRAEEQLKQKRVISTIDGFVLAKLKMPGEYVEDQAIMRVAQLDPLNVEAIVPIELFGKIALGMAAEVHPETLDAETRPARVTVVDRAGDAGSGTFGVRLEMPNPGYELPAGLKCDLRFVEDSVTATAMPSSQDGSAGYGYRGPQSNPAPNDSEPNVQKDHAGDLLSDEIVDQESAVQIATDQPNVAMSGESTADAAREPEDTSALLMAPVTVNTVSTDSADAGESDTAHSTIENHPIRTQGASVTQEDDLAIDADFELSTSAAAEDIVQQAAEDVIEEAVEDVVETAVEGMLEEAIEEIVQVDVEIVDEDQAVAVTHRAFRIGPIRSESELTRIIDLVQAEENARFQVRKEAREEASNYIVVSPVISTGEAIRALIEDMLQHGITDVMRVRAGEFEHRVSAGVFSKHHSAMLRKIRLSEAGFETEVFARTEKVDTWWVDVQYSPIEIDSLSEFQGRLGQQVSMVALDTQDEP